MLYDTQYYTRVPVHVCKVTLTLRSIELSKTLATNDGPKLSVPVAYKVKSYSFVIWITQLPRKHFLFSKTSSRRLEYVFSVTLFVFQDLLKTSSRRPQDVSAIHFPKMFSRHLQDVFKTSSRRLQDVFAGRLTIMSSRLLQDFFKKSRKTKKCYTKDVFKTPSRSLQYVLTKTNVCWVELVLVRRYFVPFAKNTFSNNVSDKQYIAYSKCS